MIGRKASRLTEAHDGSGPRPWCGEHPERAAIAAGIPARGQVGVVWHKAGAGELRNDAMQGREQRRSMKDRERFPIDYESDSEGHDPPSACGVE